MIVRNLLGRISFTETGLDNVDRKIDRTKKKGADLGDMFKGAAAALAALGVGAKALEAVNESLDFSRQLGKLQTLVPGDLAMVAKLKGGIQDLAISTGKSTTDLAAGVYEVGSAFGLTTESLELTKIAAKAATAAGSDVKTGVDLLSAVTLAYGDTSVYANQKVADLAFQAVNLGKTSLPELAAGIGKVSGAAVQLGITQEELFAIMATASGVTGPTAEAFTQFKATMTGLASPTAGLKKAYKQLGITAIESEVKQRGLVPTLERIIATTDGSVASVAKLFSSDEARALILPLVTKLQGRYAEQLKGATQASGAAEEANAAQTDGLGAAAHEADKAAARMQVLKQRIGDELAPAFTSATVEGSKLLELVADYLIPAFDTWSESSGDANDELNGMQVTARIITALLSSLAAVVDFLATVVRQLGIALGAAAAGTAALLKGDFAGAMAIDEQGQKDSSALWKRFGGRLAGYGAAFMNPEELKGLSDSRRSVAEIRRQQESDLKASARAAVTSAGNFNFNGTIEVSLPPGTPRQHVEQVGNEVGEAIAAKWLRRTRDALPNPATAGAQ